MSQIEEQLNTKFEEILKEIRTNKNYIAITDEEDVETNKPGPSNYRNKGLRNKHASNSTSDENKNRDDRFYPSEMSELGQPYTPLGIAEDTLDETIIINENRQKKADHHMVTGPTKNILRQSSTNSNTTNTQRPHAQTPLEHPEPSDPVSQIAIAIENVARRNTEPPLFHLKNTLTFNGKLGKMKNVSILKIFSTQHSKCNHPSRRT